MNPRDIIERLDIDIPDNCDVRDRTNGIVVQQKDGVWYSYYTYRELLDAYTSISLGDTGIQIDHKQDTLGIHARGYGNMTAKSQPVAALEYYEDELRLLVWGDFEDEEPTDVISLEGSQVHKKVDKKVYHSSDPLEATHAPYTIDRRDPCGLCNTYWAPNTQAYAAHMDHFGSTWVHISCYEDTYGSR